MDTRSPPPLATWTVRARSGRSQARRDLQPDVGFAMEDYPWCKSAKRVLDVVFPGDKSRIRLADLGCLEGGFAVEFARMGFRVLGLDVRESNLAACRYVKAHTNLPNLEFV